MLKIGRNTYLGEKVESLYCGDYDLSGRQMAKTILPYKTFNSCVS